jgi:hypothetical protein
MHKSSDLDSDEDFDTDADSNTDSDRKKASIAIKICFFLISSIILMLSYLMQGPLAFILGEAEAPGLVPGGSFLWTFFSSEFPSYFRTII